MAIRPTDLQSALINSTQAPPIGQRAEEGPRAAQAAQQAQFVAQTEQRNERVAETGNAQGNKIGVKDAPDRQEQQGGKGRKRERKPGDPFDEVVEEASGSVDGSPHLIDFSA
jgi:hypothetical protein